ncbi:MAG: 50S ribosomal protein L13 [Spirochaetaceae bacterium]|nr:MAG: 50S ribosomal protein L13 [Spirochaetaceae bacterium]
MKTIFVNPKEVERKWYVIDASGIPLGKVAERAAVLLQGKHKPIFVRHQEIGDYVVIINADKVDVTGNKRRDKMYHRHTGYPGGIRSENFAAAIKRNPVFPVEHAVRGMLPKNRIGRKQFTNMKVYAGTDHPHAAQKPEPVAFG